jgi:hypothetical protein
MTDASDPRCLNENAECDGPVEFHTTGDSLRAWPRCTFHQEKRWAQYDNPNSLERYANSDVPPPGFDPSYAGERWEDD